MAGSIIRPCNYTEDILVQQTTTEFKRSGTLNLSREICAFANATGGVILPMPMTWEVTA